MALGARRGSGGVACNGLHSKVITMDQTQGRELRGERGLWMGSWVLPEAHVCFGAHHRLHVPWRRPGLRIKLDAQTPEIEPKRKKSMMNKI